MNKTLRPATKSCSNCKSTYPHTFLGSRCPSCEVVNWKYQKYVIPMGVSVGAIIAATEILVVLNRA